MAEPKIRFCKEDGTVYPSWQKMKLDDIFIERTTTQTLSEDAPQLSFTIEAGVINPEDKKTNKRDFLMKDKDTKKFALTEYNDIIYNPANLKFGAIHRNKLGRGCVSPIYAIFYTDNQMPEFMELVVKDPDFIKRSLKYLEGTVEKLKSLKPRDFLQMEVAVPCLEEQQKIAAFFADLDEVIQTSEAEVTALEKQKKGAMQKIFSQEVRFKMDDGSDYPEWEEHQMNELFIITAGGDIDKANSSNVCSDDYPYAVYANALVNKGLYGYANYYKVDGDCLTITGRGDVGVAMARHEKFVPIVRLLVCKPKHNENVDFFAEAFNNSKIFIEFTGVPQLTAPQAGKVLVSHPSCLEEQQKIADFLSDFDTAIDLAKQELEKWKLLKKGLMQQMFV